MTIRAAEWKWPNISIPFAKEDSSVVERFDFVKDQNNENYDLTVIFRNGGVYRYFSVEQEDIASVIFAHSIGSMFNKLFSQAGKYRYEKIG
jgi:hypothetical protein